MNHRVLYRKRMYSGHAFNVEKLQVVLPDSRERAYDLVDHNDSVTIIPVDENGYIWFIRQYRVGSESILLELPAGVMNEGEEPEECARREIREETGLAAAKLTHLISFYLAPGYCNEINHVFFATDLSKSPLQSDEDEFLEPVKFHRDEIMEMIRSGQIKDGKSIAALYAAVLIFS